MPYNIETNDGIKLQNIPDSMSPDDPQLKQLVMTKRQEMRRASPEYQEKVKKQQEADRAEYDPMKGMSGWDKIASNLGAGVDTVVTGTKQLFGKGPSEEDIIEERQRKEKLAEGTTGGGALQFTGEVLPSMIVPAGGASIAARGVGNVFKRALGARTASMAGRGSLTADAALMGAAGGATQPVVGDESRVWNTGIGTVAGAALPAAFQGGKVFRKAFTRAGAEERAAEAARKAVGEGNVQQAIGDLQTHYPRGAENVPLSSAGILGNKELAILERQSRIDPAQRAPWMDFDVRQGEEAWNAVSRGLSEADELSGRFGKRAENWEQGWGRAEAGAKPRVFSREMGNLKGVLDDMALSPEAVNPKVMAALKQVDEEVQRLGGEFTPAHLQQLRAQLNGASSLAPKATALESAPRENPAIRALIGQLDDVLDKTTGGKWQRVRQQYADDTVGVHESKAAKIAREKFEQEGVARGAGMYTGSPQVTPAGIDRAVQATKRGDVSALSPQAKTTLANTQDVLRKQGIVRQVAGTAAPGGSNTFGDVALAAGSQSLPVPSTAVSAVQGLWEAAKGAGNRKYSEELAAALRDPARMVRLLEMKQAREGLTAVEAEALAALRGTQANAAVQYLGGPKEQ